jgi:hypothetical protein
MVRISGEGTVIGESGLRTGAPIMGAWRQLRFAGTAHSFDAWRPEFARWLHRS